jgi:alpha/beta superfamily hydrolase
MLTDVSEVRTAFIIKATMKEVRTSETSVTFYEPTRRDVPESCHFHTRHHENLKSHITYYVLN